MLTNKQINKYDEILSRGLSKGIGGIDRQMCIEAAICTTLDLPFSDDPLCVTESIRQYKIKMNDSNWSSELARSRGLRDLGLAQLGSLGVISNEDFVNKLMQKTIGTLIPTLFREIFPNNKKCLEAANMCEIEKNANAAFDAAFDAANAAFDVAYNAASVASADSAAYAASVASVANVAYAADDIAEVAIFANDATIFAANAANSSVDKYLLISISLALDTLKELNSPGCALLK